MPKPSTHLTQLLCSILLLGCCQILSAQHLEYHFEHYGNAEGLSYNTVNALYQDQKGLLWVGTWDGLCTFDGYEFICRYHDQSQANSLPTNEVNGIWVDRKNELWISTNAGVFQQGHGQKFRLISNIQKVPMGRLFEVRKDKLVAQSFPYKLSRRNFILIDMKSRQSKLVDVDDFGDRSILDMTEDGGTVWLGTKEGVVNFDPIQNRIQPTFPKVISQLQCKEVPNICKSRDGGIYFVANKEVYFKPQMLDSLVQLTEATTFSHQSIRINCLYSDHNNDLWVGTTAGLFHWSWNTRTLQSLRHDPTDPLSLSDNDITCLLEDGSRMLWVGTQNGGLNKLNLQPKPFHNYQTSFFGTEEIIKVFAFEKASDSSLWIGTNQGLFLFDRGSKKILKKYHIPHEHQRLMNIEHLTKNEIREASTIMSLCKTRSGELLLGTRSLGLYKFDKKTERLISLNKKTNYLKLNHAIRKIHETAEGQLWLLGYGLYILDPTKQKWSCQTLIRNHPHQEIELPSYYFWNLHQESENIYWISSKKGWVRWDVSKQEITLDPISKRFIDPTRRLDTRAIFCMEPSQDGFWMGTYGSGLIHLDTSNSVETQFTAFDGLANNHVYGILKANQAEDIWMSTNRGISHFEPDSKRFRNFGLADNLLIREFESNSYFKTEDDEFFFGGKNGFVHFKPSEFETNTFKAPARFTSFKVFGMELVLDSSILEKKHIQLASGQNFFEIGFSAFDFANPDAIRFEYQLVPFDPDWVSVEGIHSTKYTDLPPGHYDFQLRAANSDGILNPEIQHLYIDVLPEYYQQTWFVLLVILLILATIVGIVWQRLRIVRQGDKLRLNQATYELENETLRASLNDHFTFNSLNSIQSFIAHNDKEKAMRFVSKFGRLIRLSLENSQAQLHSLAEEIEMVQIYLELECARLSEKFEFEINLAQGIAPHLIEIPAMLIQPFLENSIWHGLSPLKAGGKIMVDISIMENEIYVQVEDNGVGRAKGRENKAKSALKYNSKGLGLIDGRLQLLNIANQKGHRYTISDLFDADAHPCGTRVEIWIPLKIEA